MTLPNLSERNILTEKDRNEKTKIGRSPLSQFSQLKKLEILTFTFSIVVRIK